MSTGITRFNNSKLYFIVYTCNRFTFSIDHLPPSVSMSIAVFHLTLKDTT